MGVDEVTVLLCGLSQTYLGTSMPSGGDHIINARRQAKVDLSAEEGLDDLTSALAAVSRHPRIFGSVFPRGRCSRCFVLFFVMVAFRRSFGEAQCASDQGQVNPPGPALLL